jgi:DNA-binding CsgD family transcriptional regulator
VRDRNSRNGSFIDDRRITEGELHIGQRVAFGKVFLELTSFGEFPADAPTHLIEGTGDGGTMADTRVSCSAAQQRVLRLLIQGFPEKQIARELDISPHTVRVHIKNIYKHLKIHSRGELMATLLSDRRLASGPCSANLGRELGTLGIGNG